MSSVISFDFNAKQVRVVELDGNPWFVAKKFQDWVTRDVLPAIRKGGAYIMSEEKRKIVPT